MFEKTIVVARICINVNMHKTECYCKRPALQLTIRAEGRNKGRQFYKCGNDNSSNFFKWADGRGGKK